MRRSVSRFSLVFALCAIVNVLGCADEVAVTLDEVEAVQQEILALLEKRAQETTAAAAAAEAAEQDAAAVFRDAGMHFSDVSAWWTPSRDRSENGLAACQAYTPSLNTDARCIAWQEAYREMRRTSSQRQQATQELRDRTSHYAEHLVALRKAHEDDTWDAIALARTGNPTMSAPSIVVTYLRELEDERTRLENLAAESQP